MLQLTQIYDLGTSTEDRRIWVNPAHIMRISEDDSEENVTVVTMVDGWTFRCRASPYYIANHC